jgi:hypothetical protein
MKVKEWCEQNGFTKHAYYYWHRKLQDVKPEQGNVFAEVLMSPTPMITDVKKTADYGLVISWKECSIHVIDSQSVPLAADLLSRLVKQC